MSEILLSICIPTFNRSHLLNKCIESIVLQEEFNSQVEIIISDNCSEDGTMQVVKNYQAKYINIKYYRNEINIGAEQNVLRVLSLAEGQLLKLSNDYVVFNKGSIKTLIDMILMYQYSHSVIFFANKLIKIKEEVKECNNIDEFISLSSYWTTWILCFGIWKTEFDILKEGDFSKSIKLKFPHLDLLLRNIELGYKPVICNTFIFTNQVLTTKGGYNFFETFIQNYLTLLELYVGGNKISKNTFSNEKSKLLHNYIFRNYCQMVLNKNSKYNFEIKGVHYFLLKYFSLGDINIFMYNVLKYKIKKSKGFNYLLKVKRII